MHSTLIFLSFAAAVLATPTGVSRQTDGPTAIEASAKCDSNSSLSCCNGKGDGDILGGLFNGCFQVPVLAVPVTQTCSGRQVAACCEKKDDQEQTLLDLSCTPISIL